jgi:hypothetical protein
MSIFRYRGDQGEPERDVEKFPLRLPWNVPATNDEEPSFPVTHRFFEKCLSISAPTDDYLS